MRRILVALALATLLTASLSACAGDEVRDFENWLGDQPIVIAVQILDSEADDLSYSASLRAELAADATEVEVLQLANDTIAYLGEHPTDNVQVQLGQHLVDFAVTTTADTKTAFDMWTTISRLPQLTNGLVNADEIVAGTSRDDAVVVFNGLRGAGVDLVVNAGGAEGVPPLSVQAVVGCEPTQGAFDLAASFLSDPLVAYGTLDMCEGFEAALVPTATLGETAPALYIALDAVGLADFPVQLSVPPEQATSSSFHIVAITPGDPAALAVLAGLEASGLDFRLELPSDRALVLESTTVTAAALDAALTASTGLDALTSVTITGTDTTITR